MERREIFLQNGDSYYYTTSMYNAKNSLGVIKATLKQFTVYKTDSEEDIVCKLYQTDKGNWFDLTENNSIDSFLSTSIKIAIDESEQEDSVVQKRI